MDFEKAYKNLVAKVKNAHLYAQTDSTKNVLEDILPELRESEDERIRKKCIELIKRVIPSGDSQSQESKEILDCIAYLEKQKEPTTEELYAEAGTTEKEYIANTMKMVRAMREKKKEQKPAEWSDYKDKVNIPYCSSEPEWSEEETKDLVHILKVLDDCYAYGKHDLSKTDHDNLTSMIKSLRPSWKPSEEQMEALRTAVNKLAKTDVADSVRLSIMYDNLKKL